MQTYTQAELRNALLSIESVHSKCEKVLPKLKPGSSQQTLLLHRIDAFVIASRLIERELERKLP